MIVLITLLVNIRIIACQTNPNPVSMACLDFSSLPTGLKLQVISYCLLDESVLYSSRTQLLYTSRRIFSGAIRILNTQIYCVLTK